MTRSLRLCVLVAVVGCEGAKAPATGDHALTVTAGFGGGQYAAGDVVRVWSGLNPQTSYLADWHATLADPGEWNSTFTMPDADTTLTATVSGPGSELYNQTIVGFDRPVLGWRPTTPRGIVLFFHGASYNRTEIQSNAGAYLSNRLMADGYAVVAIDSTDASTAGIGGWNDDPTDPNNADLVAVSQLVAAVRTDWSIPATTPVIAMGMSSGGQFAHAVGLALPAQAVVAFCAPGRSTTLAATTAPTAWFLADKDSVWPTGAADTTTSSAAMTARGVATSVNVHPATPLYDQRFERVTGVSATQSKAIADELRADGFVDADDNWLVSGMTVTAAFPLASLSGLSADQQTAVDAEVEIMAAEHELYDDYANRMLTFLDSRF